MPVLVWSDDYKTGIPDIDKEHKVLFTLINDLSERVDSGSTETAIRATISALVDYVDYHFAREEGLMVTCFYHDLENHIAGHRKMQGQIESYRNSFDRDPENFDIADFMGFLTYWLKGHILQCDMAYVPSVQKYVSSVVGER